MIYGKIGKKRNFDLFDFSSGFPEELRAARCAALVEDAHPPAKPIGLWIDLLDMLPEGTPVLDCFSGNGTTFMACQNRGRICYGNERDPSYCALILERFSTAFPNEKIEKL
jgi:DNA modification methylase